MLVGIKTSDAGTDVAPGVHFGGGENDPKYMWLEAAWAQQQQQELGQQSDKIEQVSKTVQDVGGSSLSVDSFLRIKFKEQDEGLLQLKSAFGILVTDFLDVEKEVPGMTCACGAPHWEVT